VVLIAACYAPQDRTPEERAKWADNGCAQQNPEWWPTVPLITWDAGHYLEIMRNGYPRELRDTAAFFPAHPLLARAFEPVVRLAERWHPLTEGQRCEVALVVTTHITALIGIVLLYLWVRRYGGESLRGDWVAFIAVLLLSTYPPAMYLSTGYSEGLFLLCIAATLLLLQRDHIWWAAIAASLATATRPTGLCIAAVVVLWALCYDRRPLVVRLPRVALIGLVAVSGLIAHELYLMWFYGRWDAYFAAQAPWKPARQVVGWTFWRKTLTLSPILKPSFAPLLAVLRGRFADLLEPVTWNMLLNSILVGLSIYGLCRPGRIPRVVFALPILMFLMAYLLDPALGTRMVGIARYQLVALPSFLLLARWQLWQRRPGILATLAVLMLALQIVYVRQFCNWVVP
jgi:hypothetical protein